MPGIMKACFTCQLCQKLNPSCLAVKIFDSKTFPVGDDALAVEFELICQYCFVHRAVFAQLPRSVRIAGVYALFAEVQALKKMRSGLATRRLPRAVVRPCRVPTPVASPSRKPLFASVVGALVRAVRFRPPRLEASAMPNTS